MKVLVSSSTGFIPNSFRSARENTERLSALLTHDARYLRSFTISFDDEELFCFEQIELDCYRSNFIVDLTGAALLLEDGEDAALFLIRRKYDTGQYVIQGLPRGIRCRTAPNQSFVAAESSRRTASTRVDTSIVDAHGAMIKCSGYVVDYRCIDYSRTVIVRNFQFNDGGLYVSAARDDHHATSHAVFTNLRGYCNELHTGAAFHFSGCRGGHFARLIAEGRGRVAEEHKVRTMEYAEVMAHDLGLDEPLADGTYLIYHFSGEVFGKLYRKHEVLLTVEAGEIRTIQRAVTRATGACIEGVVGNVVMDGIWVEQINARDSDTYTDDAGEVVKKPSELATSMIYVDNKVAPSTQHIKSIDIRVNHGGNTMLTNRRANLERPFITIRGGEKIGHATVFCKLINYDNPTAYAIRTIGRVEVVCETPTFWDWDTYVQMLEDPTDGGRSNITLICPRKVR